MSKDYYNTLGVSKTASQDEIKSAFRKKAHEFHPDKKSGNEAKFKEINEAYQVLGDAKKRSQFDQFGSDAFANGGHGGPGQGYGGFQGGFGGVNINMDDLGDMFGGFGDIFGFGGGRRTRRETRGADLQMVIEIDFNEAVFGTEKNIRFQRMAVCDECKGSGAEPGSKIENCNSCNGSGQVTRIQQTILGAIQTQTTCPNCNGEGKIFSRPCSKCRGVGVAEKNENMKIRIPAGIDNGERIRLSGKGHVGERGGTAGDLYIVVRVKQDKRFVRKGSDIYTKQNINIKQAILGDKIEVVTVDGLLHLKIPEGTQSGTTFKLRERGVPHLNSKSRGDHFVEITVNIPKNVSKKDKKILEEINI